MDTVFSIANTVALLAWIALFVFPTHNLVQKILTYAIVPALCLTYIFLLFPMLSDFNPEAFSSLDQLSALFTDPRSLTAGWIHYLAFDLFVGINIVKHALENNVPRRKYSVALPFTFMFGPMGLLIYYLIRLSSSK